MTADIKQRAKDIVTSDIKTMLIGTGIFTIISRLSSTMGDSIISSAISALITSVAAACSARFYFRAYNRGKGDLQDIYSMLTDSAHLSKIMTIMLAMWVINTLVTIASTFLAFIPVIGVVALLVIVLAVGYLLMLVWYLFVANPEYPTEYYLKGSSKYMVPEILSYIGFAISVSFVPVLIEMVVSIFLGETLASILCIPLEAYINLAIAGFVSGIIPDSWFDGTEVF